MNATYDYFISFSNKDVDVITKIVDAMEKYHAKCWFQKKDSRQQYAHAIMQGIKNSQTFVVFLSLNSANSMYVLNEIRCAIDCFDKIKGYKILPVVIEEQDIPEEIFEEANFYLGRLNMLFMREYASLDELVLKIFDQTGFVPFSQPEDSLYNIGSHETGRLSVQNQLVNKFGEQFVSDIVTPSANILDVGCANGSNIISLLGKCDYATLLGVDISTAKINEANEAYGSDKNTFLACDVNTDAFRNYLDDYLDKLDVRGFDVIYVSFLLLHVGQPANILKVLKRYLNKNGYLYIQDIDDGTNIAYPATDFFDKAFFLWQNSKESGDRQCGRKIPIYLKEAGFGEITLLQRGISTLDLTAEENQMLWDLYFNHNFWEVDDMSVFKNSVQCKSVLDEYRKEYETHKREFDNGNVFVQIGFMFYCARK